MGAEVELIYTWIEIRTTVQLCSSNATACIACYAIPIGKTELFDTAYSERASLEKVGKGVTRSLILVPIKSAYATSC